MKLVWPGSNIVPGWMVLASDEAATIVTNDLGAPHPLGGAPHNLGVVGAVGPGACVVLG